MSAEPWRGDSEPEETPAFLRPFLPRTLTPEEQLERDARLAAARTLGDQRYARLPRLRRWRRCRQCGGWRSRLVFCPGSHPLRLVDVYCLELVGARPHLHRQCRRCGHHSVERTLEDPPPETAG